MNSNAIRSKYFIVAVILLGCFLRFLAFNRWSLGFDQVQIIKASRLITMGDFTLIGPRTGQAAFFTGPLIYYLNSTFVLIGLGDYSIIATTLVISIITGLFLYYLSRRYFGNEMAKILVLLWAVSQFLITADQTTWNPNLTFLASMLVFFPCWYLSAPSNKFDHQTYLLLAIGGFMGYQAHFSGFMLLPLSMLLVFRFKTNFTQSIVAITSVFAGLVISIIPTGIFDLRHQWINYSGLKTFLLNTLSSSSNPNGRIYHLWKSFYTTFETFGKIIFDNYSLPITAAFIAGIFLMFGYLFFIDKKKNFYQLFPPIWIIIVATIFGFYSGDKPPYYFYIQLPAMLAMIATICLKINRQSIKILFATLLLTAGLTQLSQCFRSTYDSLSTAIKIKKYILKQSLDLPIDAIYLNFPQGTTFGLEYVFETIPLSDMGSIAWYLSYPVKVAYANSHIGGVDIWHQEPVSSKTHVFSNEAFRIKTPISISIYEDRYYRGSADKNLIILNNGVIAGQLEIKYNRKTENIYESSWVPVDAKSSHFYYSPSQILFTLYANNSELGDLTNQVEIF